MTGSAHTALAALWSARLGRDELVGLQASARSGVVRTRVVGDRVAPDGPRGDHPGGHVELLSSPVPHAAGGHGALRVDVGGEGPGGLLVGRVVQLHVPSGSRRHTIPTACPTRSDFSTAGQPPGLHRKNSGSCRYSVAPASTNAPAGPGVVPQDVRRKGLRDDGGPRVVSQHETVINSRTTVRSAAAAHDKTTVTTWVIRSPWIRGGPAPQGAAGRGARSFPDCLWVPTPTLPGRAPHLRGRRANRRGFGTRREVRRCERSERGEEHRGHQPAHHHVRARLHPQPPHAAARPLRPSPAGAPTHACRTRRALAAACQPK